MWIAFLCFAVGVLQTISEKSKKDDCNIDYCELFSKMCKNGGVCERNGCGSAECKCPDHTTGRFCDVLVTPKPETSSSEGSRSKGGASSVILRLFRALAFTGHSYKKKEEPTTRKPTTQPPTTTTTTQTTTTTTATTTTTPATTTTTTESTTTTTNPTTTTVQPRKQTTPMLLSALTTDLSTAKRVATTTDSGSKSISQKTTQHESTVQNLAMATTSSVLKQDVTPFNYDNSSSEVEDISGNENVTENPVPSTKTNARYVVTMPSSNSQQLSMIKSDKFNEKPLSLITEKAPTNSKNDGNVANNKKENDAKSKDLTDKGENKVEKEKVDIPEQDSVKSVAIKEQIPSSKGDVSVSGVVSLNNLQSSGDNFRKNGKNDGRPSGTSQTDVILQTTSTANIFPETTSPESTSSSLPTADGAKSSNIETFESSPTKAGNQEASVSTTPTPTSEGKQTTPVFIPLETYNDLRSLTRQFETAIKKFQETNNKKQNKDEGSMEETISMTGNDVASATNENSANHVKSTSNTKDRNVSENISDNKSVSGKFIATKSKSNNSPETQDLSVDKTNFKPIVESTTLATASAKPATAETVSTSAEPKYSENAPIKPSSPKPRTSSSRGISEITQKQTTSMPMVPNVDIVTGVSKLASVILSTSPLTEKRPESISTTKNPKSGGLATTETVTKSTTVAPVRPSAMLNSDIKPSTAANVAESTSITPTHVPSVPSTVETTAKPTTADPTTQRPVKRKSVNEMLLELARKAYMEDISTPAPTEAPTKAPRVHIIEPKHLRITPKPNNDRMSVSVHMPRGSTLPEKEMSNTNTKSIPTAIGAFESDHNLYLDKDNKDIIAKPSSRLNTEKSTTKVGQVLPTTPLFISLKISKLETSDFEDQTLSHTSALGKTTLSNEDLVTVTTKPRLSTT